jgi:ATP-binding cassette subfamily F protein 3
MLTVADIGSDENITLDLRYQCLRNNRKIQANSTRGTRFTLSRDELLTLPEFVLLSLFPNGLLPDGHMNSFIEGDVYPVDVRSAISILFNPDIYISDTVSSQYDPASLTYMLEFFRNVAQTIPSGPPSPSDTPSAANESAMAGSARDMLQDRAGIIVLREDLDFYAIPPKSDIEQPEMIEVKRAAGKALLKQDGIFSGLRRSDETGTTEQHLIEMLTAGYEDPQ